MKHFVFNVVVIGALAFIFLKDGDVELPFDFTSNSPVQTSVEEHAAIPDKIVSAVAESLDVPVGPEPQKLSAPAEVASAESLVPKNTVPFASEVKPVAEPAVALQQPDGRGAVAAQVAPVRSAESVAPMEALPPIAPPVTVSTPVVNTVPSPALEEEKLPAAVSISVAAAPPAKPAPTFMSPKERQRELNRMIEELETFYLEKFTR